jgi:hypothetical protein
MSNPFVILYKDGGTSPPLHPIDAAAWMTLGWSTEEKVLPKEDIIDEPPPSPPAPKTRTKQLPSE